MSHHHYAQGGHIANMSDFPHHGGHDLEVHRRHGGEFIEEKKKEKPIHVKGDLRLKKGLVIEGPGKGQDDTIHTKAKEGSYIIDASTLSMLGDGSTEAGAEVLKDFLDSTLADMDHHAYSYMLEEEHHKPKIPVALSRDEAYIRPSYVMAIGGGDHSKGVKTLNKLVARLRHHKSSNGTKLPPKSKPIKHYLR
jgi:hypothetical protein